MHALVPQGSQNYDSEKIQPLSEMSVKNERRRRTSSFGSQRLCRAAISCGAAAAVAVR